MFALATTAFTTAQSSGFSFSGATNTISNLIGGTKNICNQMISDEQFQALLARAKMDESIRNDPDMDRVARRYGYNDMSAKHGNPRSTAIYRAPYSDVRAWYRRDCGSAGPIGQEVTRDLNLLVNRYLTNQFAGADVNGGTGALQDSGPTAGDALSEILRNLGRAAVQTGQATIEGGLEGGVAASRGAATGSEVGATLVNRTTTLILLGVVAFLSFKAFS